MKIKISYVIPVEKEIELSPEEYCFLKANFSSRKDIFPENTFNQKIDSFDELSKTAKEELENFWENKVKKA